MKKEQRLLFKFPLDKMNTPIRIVIADDEPTFVKSTKGLFQGHETIKVVDDAKDGKELLGILDKRLLQSQQTDIVLLDYNMPRMNGLEAAKRIKMSYPTLKIVMLTNYSEEYLIKKTMSFGANGYLVKGCTENELVDCILDVMRNVNHFPQKMSDSNFSQYLKEDALLNKYQLTKKEMEIIQYLKEGFADEEISKQLLLSTTTIEVHRRNLCLKLGVQDQASLIKFLTKKCKK